MIIYYDVLKQVAVVRLVCNVSVSSAFLVAEWEACEDF